MPLVMLQYFVVSKIHLQPCSFFKVILNPSFSIKQDL